MKRKLLFLLLCTMSLALFLFNRWLPMQNVAIADIATGDGNQPVDYGGNSDFDPDLKSERNFYTDVGGDLDKYLYRDDLQATNGRLTFEIDIDRYFSTKISTHVDPVTGLLPPNIVTDLVNNKLLPPTATLTLIVFDVDHDAACPEIDHVYVNDLPIYKAQNQGVLASLVSGNEKWLPVRYEIPISYLKLPWEWGQNGQRPSALNQVAIDVNIACAEVDWALKVDWGSITIVNPQRRPIVFAPNWTGGLGTYTPFSEFAAEEGIPVLEEFDLGNAGTRPIREMAFSTAPTLGLMPHIDEALTQFGVDKVDILAHSKGGIISRIAFERKENAQKVAHLISLDSPHHGSDAVPIVGDFQCFLFFSGAQAFDCLTSGYELSVRSMRDFNYANCQFAGVNIWVNCIPKYVRAENITYYTLAAHPVSGGVGARTATYPWNADWAPFPILWNVDHTYFLHHGQFKTERLVFDDALALIDGTPPLMTASQAKSQQAEQTMAASMVATSTVDEQTILHVIETIGASNTQTQSVYVDSGSDVLFSIISHEPLSATIKTPSGSVIDPTVAVGDPTVEYYSEQGNGYSDDGWSYHYHVANPQLGQWELIVNSPSANSYLAVSSLFTDLQLAVWTDVPSYQPGQTVTINAAIYTDTTPLTGSTISATLTLPDLSTQAITFVDNGTNGDTTAGDGLYAAQVTASPMNGHTWLAVNATNGNLQRIAQSGFPVVAQTATFQQVTGANPVDTNGNGLYNRLDIDLSLTVITGGDYGIFGTLTDGNGIPLTTASISVTLASGQQTATLGFDGEALRNHGIDGPYTLTNIIIDYQDPSAFSPLTVDTATDVFTTTAYSHRQFEGDLVTSVGTSETVTDTNGNGLYDQLTVELDLDVIFPGQFDWMGMLEDQYGHPIARFDGSGYLDSQTPMTFTFSGREINKAALDGPFKLRGVAFNQTSGGNANVILGEVHTTAAQFEPPLACGGPVPPVVNAYFEQRVIELVNIERANVGLPPMKRAEPLMNSARYHAHDTKVDNYLEHDSHDRVNGELTFVCHWDERINTFYPSQWFLSENLAGQYGSPESVMAAWMSSSGHRGNILGGNTEIGVGYDSNWVQNFRGDPSVIPLVINGEAATTPSTSVTLYVYGPWWDEIRLRNNSGIWSSWQPFTNTLSWSLDPALGLQLVEAEVRNESYTYATTGDTIEYIGPATPTPTQTLTPTPTATPTVVPTPLPLNATTLYLSPSGNGTVAGVSYADEDLLAFDLATSSWSLFFDGSAAGISTAEDINAFHLETDGTLLLSFENDALVPDVGTVGKSDIVRFIPATWGSTTGGNWEFYFDGSAVGLGGGSEVIDGIGRHPDGRLLLSVANDYDTGTIAGEDEDILLFTATGLGENTAGSWELYLDGSTVDLGTTGYEDITGFWSDPATGNLYFATAGDFSVNGLSGDSNDISICVPNGLGESSHCDFFPFWDGDSYGFSGAIYALAFGTGAVTLPTPTATPTPVATPQPLNATTLYLTSNSSGSAGGVSYTDEDIVAFDVATSSWALFFDGSVAGIPTAEDINAFSLEVDGSLLLSFESGVTLPVIGSVAESDIVRFTPTTAGDYTAGSWELYFDGSDVNLSGTAEDIDAIARHPDGRLLLSFAGEYDTGTLTGEDEDLLLFTATSLGDTTAGSWEIYLDGSDVGLATTDNEDIWGLWSDPATANLYLTTAADYSVHGLSGDRDDIFVCVPVALGASSSCSFFLFWDGDAHGFSAAIYDFVIATGSGGAMTTGGESETGSTDRGVELTSQIYLPLVTAGAGPQPADVAETAPDQESPADTADVALENRIYLPLIER